MSKTTKAKAPVLNTTPGGSFTKDPATGKLTRVESTKRASTTATATADTADKAVAKAKE